MSLQPGTIIDRYRIDTVIGGGSMGDVFLGLDDSLDRRVAIKILSEKHRDNEELRARFVREGRAVAAISHPNVVQVFTTGTFDDRPFIAMEYLDGTDLGSHVEQVGPLSPAQAARAVRDAARGLEAAATAGLIHRDVKPSNLVLLTNGVVKVTDFGLAKPLEPGNEPALTAMGVVVGTPDYIAPEQARGDTLDERVDIYALGGTLFFLLTGRPPFRTGKPADDKYLKVVARHLRQAPPSAHQEVRGLDRELSELARRMMSKSSEERPGYPELLGALEAVIARLETSAGDSQLARPARSSPALAGRVAPTPFIGSTLADADDELAPTRMRIPTQPPDSARTAARELHDSAHTSAIGTELDELRGRPKRARWLIAVTVASVAVFLVGLGLLLFGPLPSLANLAPDAGVLGAIATDATPTVSPALPEPPPGMLLLTDTSGNPRLFVAAAPVEHGDYSALFPTQKRLLGSARANARPVRSVAFKYAQAYARAKDARLLSPEEWAAAAELEGFEHAGPRLWEWVNDGTTGVSAPRPVTGPAGIERRPPVAHSDVTFRLARDL